MHNSNMDQPTSYNPINCNLRLNVILIAFHGLNEWEHSNLSAPYWRLYYNPGPGAFVMSNSHEFALTPDIFTVIAPNTPYSTRLANPVDHFYLHFTISSLGVAPIPGIYQWIVHKEELDKLSYLIKQIQSDTIRSLLDFPACEMAAHSLVQLPEHAWSTNVMEPRISRIVEYISHNPLIQLSNDHMAKMVAMSTNGFIRLFTEQVGISPHKYALQARLDHAAILLHHSEKSIDMVAQECGFYDRNYFTRMFTSYLQCSPAKFRKQRKR